MKSLFKMSPRTSLSMMMLVAVMVLSLRLGDIWTSVTTGAIFTTVSVVQAEPEAEKKEEKAHKIEERKTHKTVQKEILAESKLYQQLAGRREQLDKRSRKLDDRETLVVVAESRINQKIKEMQTLKKQLESLLGQASGARQQQLDNLVKVYESMKPKEASKIFEELGMPILLQVIQKMKPKKTAAILAKMNPQRAKDITVALTRRDKLPQL